MTAIGWDFRLPDWWYDDDVTDEERSRWLTQRRCREQVKRQTMPSVEARKDELDRLDRREGAKSGRLDLSKWT